MERSVRSGQGSVVAERPAGARLRDGGAREATRETGAMHHMATGND